MAKSNVSLSTFIANVVTVADRVEVDALKLLTGIVHLVEAGAPIAEVIGGAIGQPEVNVVAAGETTAQAATAAPEIAGLTS